MQQKNPNSVTSHRPRRSEQSGTARGSCILLVSTDPHWTVPVREAVAAGGGSVETVSAETAVARLAGPGSPASHVLVDRTGAHGLLPLLVEMTSDTASAETVVLYLGADQIPDARTRAIHCADRRSISDALAIRHFPARHNEPCLSPNELRAIVDGAMIETRYQPIARIADRSVATVEVLARLNHPIHGTLTPDWFVPRFEDAGLSFGFTDLVSTRAFNDQTSSSFMGLGLAMALNYPLNVLSHKDAATSLDEKRAALGIPASQIVIELTESRPVEDFGALGRSLEHLRRLGYRIAIDDVGPAVKNLEKLLTLPFTGLKLDKSIVRMIGLRGPRGSYAPRVIEMAHALGLNIVAEGLENQDLWETLNQLGVHEAQGYFVGRPLPRAAVPIWMDAWAHAPSGTN